MASSIFSSFPTNLGDSLVFVLVCAVVILIVLLAVYLIAAVLGLLLRLLFRQVRFVVVFLLSLAAIAAFVVAVFFNPLQQNNGDTQTDTILEQVADKYKGLYPGQLPFVAWKISDITDDAAEAGTDGIVTTEGGRVYKVSYLPFGELIVHVDPDNGQLDIKSSADEGNFSVNIKSIMDSLVDSVQKGADKTITAIGDGVDKSVDYIKDQTDGLTNQAESANKSE